MCQNSSCDFSVKLKKMFQVDLLIELVKARPPLYNSSLLEYKSKTYNSVLWKQIADELGKEVSQCRSVWTSLRSSYARHLQNMENNKKGLNERKKAEWYLAEKMCFLDDFMLRTPQERCLTTDNEDQNNTNHSADDNSMSMSNYEFNNESFNNIDDSHSAFTIKSEEINCSPYIVTDNYNSDNGEVMENDLKMCREELMNEYKNMAATYKRKKKTINSPSKRLKITNNDEMDLDACEDLTNAKAREDSILMFFKSMLFDMKKLSNKKLRLFKQDVLQDLNKYLEDDENDC